MITNRDIWNACAQGPEAVRQLLLKAAPEERAATAARGGSMIPNDDGMAECSDEEWSLAQADAACDFIEAVPLSAMDNPAMVTEMWARFRKLASAWRNRGDVMEEREACAKELEFLLREHCACKCEANAFETGIGKIRARK